MAVKQAKVMATTTAVATVPKKEIGMVLDYGTDAGIGFENQTAADFTIPRIMVLQDNSKLCKSSEKARPGMFYNTVTEELFPGKEGVLFVPVVTKHVFNEWIPRKKGGGFVGSHDPLSPEVVKAKADFAASTDPEKRYGDYYMPNGNELVETFDVYAVTLDGDGQPAGPAIISFVSKKIKPYKGWITRLSMFTVKTPSGNKQRPPLFAHRTRLVAFLDKNADGEFYNFVLQPADDNNLQASLLPPGHAAMEAAMDLKAIVDQGRAKAHEEGATEVEATVSAGTDPNWQA